MAKGNVNGSKRSRKKKVPSDGRIYVHTTWGNVIITFTDNNGDTIAWSSCGKAGFFNAKKRNTAYATTVTVSEIAKSMYDSGFKTANEVYISGGGAGRDSALKAIIDCGIKIKCIIDVTPLPHNGCRPSKRRRN